MSLAYAEDGTLPPQPAGRLEVPMPVYDAGKVERGALLRHAFLVKNIGTAELAIDAKPG